MPDGALPGEERALQETQTWRFPGQRLSDVLRAVTTTQVIVPAGLALAALLWLAGARRDAIALAAIMVVLPMAQAGLKEIIDRARPSADEFVRRASVTSESFPSGHAMGPAVLFGYVLWLCTQPRWPVALRAAAGVYSAFVLALIGLVNVWLGVHWPSDVVGGYLWGAALVLPAIWFASRGQGVPTSGVSTPSSAR